MSQRKYLLGAFLLTSAFAIAQGPITDNVKVNFPNPVVVAGTTLPAGEYTIRQLPSANNPRVLEFSSDNGTKVEVTTTTYPILDNMAKKPTSVILEQRGDTYHVSKIWLQGKSYGYGFIPGDGPVTTASTNQGGMRLTASYAPAPAEPQPVAQATPPVQEQTPTPAPAQPEPQPQVQQQTQDQAQATPPEQPAPTPAPAQEPAPTPAAEPAPAATTPEMPATASHWTLLMMAGGFLTAAGLRMRR